MSGTTTPFTHLVASREGLYLARPSGYLRVMDGIFFGATIRDGMVWLFESEDSDLHAPTCRGRILRLAIDPVSAACGPVEVVAQGLDNGCHQIDFVRGRLVVVDTYRQALIVFAPDFSTRAVHHPAGIAMVDTGDPAYVHMNGIGGDGRDLLVMLSHAGTRPGRPSEVLRLDSGFQPVERFGLPGVMCHDLVVLEDGRLIANGSMGGFLIDRQGIIIQVDSLITRGLSIGADEVVIGSSTFGDRDRRIEATGRLTFAGRDLSMRARYDLPAAPTQIRRLDGLDLSLFDYRATLPATLQPASDPVSEPAPGVEA
ncbi:hypothetical protein GCM10011505_39980 [Tistrella bauzanensis]|uniref:Sugar lactone lactonase YvrE n=1 Tax=Tistrella bauzanensis TaxID=657419 RepID=A0ABQ1IZH3_9PROT|nr:hypothetical protein [Tistrella bauzanensis]GGB54985.1 hypothetical protein GCM10011505_39980 [Tistrella bauzanensis]